VAGAQGLQFTAREIEQQAAALERSHEAHGVFIGFGTAAVIDLVAGAA
jgi:hypothetical protein